MWPLLNRVIKKMPVATVEDEYSSGSKRSAAQLDEIRKAKEAKFDEAKGFGFKAFGVGANCDLEVRSHFSSELSRRCHPKPSDGILRFWFTNQRIATMKETGEQDNGQLLQTNPSYSHSIALHCTQ